MLTFTDQQLLFQQITDDYSSATLVMAKRDINEGGAMFLNRLGRKFNKEYLTGNIYATRQYYQFSAGVLRISEIRVLNGTTWYTPQLITSEQQWNKLNAIPQSGNYPTAYYIRGFNEVGLYPVPSSDLANAMQVSYEPQHIDLTQDDFGTAALTAPLGTGTTVTVSNGSPNGTTITHSATGFTQSMVGRWFQVTDGTDGKWYRISGLTSSSVLTLENYYEGLAGSGRSFRIGEIMKIPNGYQDAPVFFACERFYMTQNDQRTPPVFAQRFEQRLNSAKATYGRSTSRMGVRTKPAHNGAFDNWIYFTPPVSYP